MCILSPKNYYTYTIVSVYYFPRKQLLYILYSTSIICVYICKYIIFKNFLVKKEMAKQSKCTDHPTCVRFCAKRFHIHYFISLKENSLLILELTQARKKNVKLEQTKK